MESKHITVSRPCKFVPGYLAKVIKAQDEYKSWIAENFGYKVDYESVYNLTEKRMYFKFEFRTEEDAVAFKLRWS